MNPIRPVLLVLMLFDVFAIVRAEPEPGDTPARPSATGAEYSLADALTVLAGPAPATVDNRVRRPVSTLTLRTRQSLDAATTADGLIELLTLRGVSVSRTEGRLIAEDMVDPSEAIILQVRDKSLPERAPLLVRDLATTRREPVHIAAERMPLDGVLNVLEVVTGRILICDQPLPRVHFSCPVSSLTPGETLTALDTFLAQQQIYLVEHDSRLLKVVFAPGLHTPASRIGEPDMSDDEVKARMERVAREIRARREQRKAAAERPQTGAPETSSNPAPGP
ncbi:MAG: hypothetical protein IAE82_01945 [Opitutaceae bacterium]|nr:hypothetical protein [Opitutaceae bacterium]